MTSVIECMVISFGVGLIFALVYELLRIIRLLIPVAPVIFICDVLFFILAAFIVIKLAVALGNYVRGCIVFGFGAGIFAYITTIGRLMNIIENTVIGIISDFFYTLFRTITGLFGKCFRFIAHKCNKVFGIITKKYSNHKKTRRNDLKKNNTPVYNNINTKNNSGGSVNNHAIAAKIQKGINA